MPVRASGSGKILVLPISDPLPDQERDRLIGGDDDDEEKLFKGSAMTRRRAYAAISYMAYAGKQQTISSVNYAPYLPFDSKHGPPLLHSKVHDVCLWTLAQ